MVVRLEDLGYPVVHSILRILYRFRVHRSMHRQYGLPRVLGYADVLFRLSYAHHVEGKG